jgi:hypothetical protein
MCTDCTTSLFYILAPICFGSSLSSSGSFLDPSEFLEIRIEWVVYHIMCGYVVCVLDCRGSVCCASQLGTTTLQQTGHVTTRYMIYHPFDLYFQYILQHAVLFDILLTVSNYVSQ